VRAHQFVECCRCFAWLTIAGDEREGQARPQPKKGLVPFESEIKQHWFMQMVRWYGAYLENLKKLC
jgi:hypothetical protein